MSKHKINTTFPTNEFYDKYSSQIKPIKIHLPKSEKDGKYFDFVGREKLMERLYAWMTNSSSTGSYLVTGFRGMGKTVLVNRTMERLTRDIGHKKELLCHISIVALMCSVFVFGYDWLFLKKGELYTIAIALLLFSLLILIPIVVYDPNKYRIRAFISRLRFPHGLSFNKYLVDKLIRGKNIDDTLKKYSNIKVSINLGHEILNERDILCMIAHDVKEKYTKFVKGIGPHFFAVYLSVLVVCVIGMVCVYHFDKLMYYTMNIHENGLVMAHDTHIQSPSLENALSVAISNQQGVSIQNPDTWMGRFMSGIVRFLINTRVRYQAFTLFLLFALIELLLWWMMKKVLLRVPLLSTPKKAIKRLEHLEERIVATTDEEIGASSVSEKKVVAISIFGHKRRKIYPVADVREIETELSDIINSICSKDCVKEYRARFFVVFDEMDKIDPEMMDMSKVLNMPEYVDSVKGFPDGMSSRERRRNVLKLLANIKLFITTAKAKFVFISGRELYDAYLADLSDRDFAISSIFTGVINVDSFLTPEGGQTDVRSMSEWYISNRLIPDEWLRWKERKNASENNTLKKEMPSLKWYYEYLISECGNNRNDASYIIGFLHVFAAYLTHISNGSPKKIFLYFDKYVKLNDDCRSCVSWNDVCEVGKNRNKRTKDHRSRAVSQVLWFNQTQQKTINFVYYLANPIMGTITNDLSNYGDRFLVTLSFVIDHIYKHHNRSFSWRNLEQVPDLLKTSKAPELRESMTSILEHMAQTHVSHILIGLNEYKFRKSISEEISVMSKLSEEASAIFNFTLDESLAVIQHNTLLLNYYIQLEQKELASSDKTDKNRCFQPIIARIHSNLGDLHYWDEDYYKASLEYRAAIDALGNDDEQGFLTKVRCMLKLGLTYESRKLYPNAYQLYSQLTSLLIQKRWVDEKSLGLDVVETRVNGWREKRLALVDPMVRAEQDATEASSYKQDPGTIPSDLHDQEKYYLDYRNQFKPHLWEDNESLKVEYGTNVDGVVSSFARNLTPDKARFVNSLSLFEEIRYVYQAILAKLCILDKMGMSGITQTSIDVAEGEFRSLHRSANIKEKFIISADFFRKLAEILYYKNSLTILSQNQDSFYASLYFADYDILANLDDYCRYSYEKNGKESNALKIKRDVKFFFNYLNNSVCSKKDSPRFESISKDGTLEGILNDLLTNLDGIVKQLPFDKAQYDFDQNEIKKNVREYINYNIEVVYRKNNSYPKIDIQRINYCDFHRQELRKHNLRPPCYACKYYTRSLLILAENMFVDNGKDLDLPNKAFQLLRLSFKEKLLYTRSIHIDTLAQTIEGFANVIFSCSSGDKYDIPIERTHRGLSPDLIQMLQRLCVHSNNEDEHDIIDEFRTEFSHRGSMSRLDKSILYYFVAFRFYIIGTSYGEAVRCLNRIITILVYYVEIISYEKNEDDHLWGDESDAIIKLIGNKDFEGSFVSSLFTLIVRYTGYMYDLTNLTEINEMKWIFSRQYGGNIDLSRLSLYPNVRASFLRIVEILAKGNRYLSRKRSQLRSLVDYQYYVRLLYPLIAPDRRYETTFNEEILGFYTKLRFNDHILNNILHGNPIVESRISKKGNVSYHILFYKKIADYLSNRQISNRLDQTMFNVGDDPQKKLDLIEFLIHDSLVCLANMTQVFTPHNHLTSYSKSFIGVVYNYFWEWSRKYEFLYSLYKYSEVRYSEPSEADNIINGIYSGIRRNNKDDTRKQLIDYMNKCCDNIEIEKNTPFGKRSTRLYEKLRHDIDDITLNTIFSNYTAEMAINYYNMSEEFNTEGDSYKDMISMMHFLDDDFNNDTCQFHVACDRFLLNTNIVQTQREHLESLYYNSNVYNIKKAYIDGPLSSLNEHNQGDEKFDESLFINSEY